MLRKITVVLAACAALLAAPAGAASITYNIALEGYQVAGSYVVTSTTGAGTATFDTVTKQLAFNLAHTASLESGAHIHGPAARGQNAPVLFTLASGSPKSDVVTLDAGQEAMLLAGQLYVDIHTLLYPDGQLRGQVDNLGATVLRTLSATQPAGGTIQGGPQGANNLLNCGDRCSVQVADGTLVTLSVAGGPVGHWAQWGGACAGTPDGDWCELTMDGDKSVSATFVALGGVDISGTLTAAPNPAVVGQDVTFTITVTNAGPGAAEFPAAELEVLAGFPFVSAGAGCTHYPAEDNYPEVVYCHVSKLVANASTQFTVVLRATAAGSFPVVASTSSDDADYDASNNDPAVDLVVTSPSARLVNISTRMQVLTGDNVMIGGLIVGGPVNKTVVIRARGPSMVPAGVTNPLVNPKLDLYSGQTVIATSDDWGGNTNATAVTASGFAPPEAAEGAILINLAPGPYTAIVSGVGGTTGVGLVEVFEVDHPEVPLINIATRGRVQTGLDVMIAGFIIQGTGQQGVVVRARGPSLAAAGVPGVLANPTLKLVRSSDGVVIAANDDWATAANAAAVTASGFAPADPLEAAILISLDPGAYTAVVEGVGGTSGVAIVEVFRN